MAEITLVKIVEMRQAAASAIARIVSQFEDQTFCSVERIDLEKMDTGEGTRKTSGLTLQVSMPGTVSPELFKDR